MALFPFVIGIIFIMAPFAELLFGLKLFSDLGLFLSIIIFLVGVFACFVAKSALKSSFAFLGTSGGWRVEITDETLSWDSPIEELQKSFKINLGEISYIESIAVKNADPLVDEGLGYNRRYVIHKHSGGPIHLKEDISGIWPHRVFKDLKKRGIEYVETVKEL